MFREVNLNKVGAGGMTALGYASLARKLDAVKLVVEKGVEVNLGGLLVRAFEMGDIGFIDYLLEKGAHMSFKSVSESPVFAYYNSVEFPKTRYEQMYEKPLLLALELGGHFERFFALEAKRDSSLSLLDYQSAFFIASTRNYLDVAEYLLKHHPELGESLFKATTGEKHSLGVDAFIQAAHLGHTSILKLMVDSVRQPEDWAPVLSKALLFAERYGNRKSTEFILEQAYGVGRGIR